MDLIIILILIVIAACFFRDYKNVVYLLGIIEIFFRILHFIGDHLKLIPELNKIINAYIPTSLFTMLGKYSSGLLYEILMWMLLAVFISFEVYLIRYFLKRGK